MAELGKASWWGEERPCVGPSEMKESGPPLDIFFGKIRHGPGVKIGVF